MSNTSNCKSPTKSASSQQVKIKNYDIQCLKCFICNKIVKISHLSEHLLFGEVKCAKCPVVLKNCQDFQFWTVEQKMGHLSCDHVLQYSRDPLKNLEMHISNQYQENNIANKTSLTDMPGHLKTYVRGLKSLKRRMPWQAAVAQFKKYFIDHNEKTKKVTSISKLPANTKYSSHKDNMTTLVETAKNVDVYEFTASDQGFAESVSDRNLPNHSIASHERLPSQKNKCEVSNIANKKRKYEVKKRKKTEWVSGLTKKKACSTSKAKRPVGYVETPLNGFYYVVRHAVTECPNCYAAICPPDFTVNIVTFLMTAVCRDCDLTIYIVHDPPDDSAPRVCIVTADDQRLTPRKKN